MPIDADALKKLLEDGGGRIVAVIKESAGQYLDGRQDQKAFLEERAKRLAELGVELAKSAFGNDRDRILASIETVTDAITSECWSIAVDTSAEARNVINAVVKTAKDFVVEVLPVIAKILLA